MEETKEKFGTFKGVFLPSVLTIFGVIMYLRLGWVVGNAGLAGTLFIVTLSSAITFFTALSIAATATNMKVEGGGAYFMISRSFGLEAGAAIGVPLFLAQALGVSFYIAGFTESIHNLVPTIDPVIIGVGTLTTLTILTFVSTDLALKTQLIIFMLITASLASFFMGDKPQFEEISSYTPEAPFWAVFAVFFPAVTGIEAGIALSGDLKNPAKSLTFGTISAVVIGYIIYILIPIFLWTRVPEEILKSNPLIMRDLSKFGEVVTAGLWGAALSSALGALLGAPRTLQALAKDGIVPQFLSVGQGESDLPRNAMVVSTLVALTGIAMGDLNAIASVLSMFFLTSYGFLNLSAAFEGLIANPSWRPEFKTPWWISLIGAALCFMAMFMINPGATFLAGFLSALIYYITYRRKLRPHWQDMRRSILMSLARFSIYKLAEYLPSAKSWRPNMLVLSGSPTSRWHLIELGNEITHGKGFFTVASVLTDSSMNTERLASFEKSVREYLKKRGVQALVEVHPAEDLVRGAEDLVKTYGLGPIFPNTILMGATQQDENFQQHAELIKVIHQAKRNILIVKKSAEGTEVKKGLFGRRRKRIDVWWGRQRQNAGLMLVVAYMLQTSTEWSGSKLYLKSVVDTEEERSNADEYLAEFFKKSRLTGEIKTIVRPSGKTSFETILENSKDAALIFIGMRPPEKDETIHQYADYYENLLSCIENYPKTVIVLASEAIQFDEIFN